MSQKDRDTIDKKLSTTAQSMLEEKKDRKTAEIPEDNEKVEINGKVEDTATARIDVKKEGTSERYGQRRENFRKQEIVQPILDRASSDFIEDLDAQKLIQSPEKIQESMSRLMTISSTLLSRLFDNDIPLEDLNEFGKLKNFKLNQELLVKLTETEKKTLEKLQKLSEISNKVADIKYLDEINRRWKQFATSIHDLKPAITVAKNYLSATSTTTPLSQNPDQAPPEEGTLGTVKKFVSQHSSKLLIGTIALAGAYGIYKFFSDDDEKTSDESSENEKEMSGWLGKISDTLGYIKYPLLIGGTAFFLAGAILGPEKVMSFLSGTWGNIKEALALLLEGKFKDAITTLTSGPNPYAELHQKAIISIKQSHHTEIRPATMQQLGALTLQDFIGEKAVTEDIATTIQDNLKEKARSVLTPKAEEIPIIGDALKKYLGSNPTTEDLAEINALKSYLKNNQSKLEGKIKADMTINEALSIILSMSFTPKPNETTHFNPDQKVEIAQDNQTQSEVLNALNAVSVKLDNNAKRALIKDFMTECQERWIDSKESAAIINQAQLNNIATVHLTPLLTARTEKLNALLELMRNNASAENLARLLEEVMDTNEALGTALNELKTETLKKTGWDETIYLTWVQAPMFIKRYLRAPKLHREYAKYLLSKYVSGAVSKGVETGYDLYKRISGIETPLTQLEEDIKKLEHTNTALQERKKQYNTNKKTPESLSEADRLTQTRDLTQADLIEQDLEIAKKTHTLHLKQAELNKLKTGTHIKAQLENLEKAIAEETETIENLKAKRITLKNAELEAKIRHDRHVLEKRIGTKGVPEIHKADFEKIDHIVAEVESHRKYIDQVKAEKFAKAEKLPAGSKEQKRLIEEINRLDIAKMNFNLGAFDILEKVNKTWYANFQALRGKEVSEEAEKYLKGEQAQLISWFNRILGAANDNAQAEKAVTKPLINTFKGNIIFYGTVIGVGILLNYDHKKGGNFWLSVEQTALDIAPFTGTFSDFYAAWEGKEYITGAGLDSKDRIIRTVFGFGGALCDLSTLAGMGIMGRRTLSALKESKAIGKSISFKEAFDAARASGKDIDNLDALRAMKEGGHWATKMAMTGALGLAGYSLVYQPLASRTLKPETQALLSGQLQETHLEPPKINSPLA